MKEIYVALSWDKKKGKKKANFGKVWGKLPESEANATAILTGNGLVVVDIDTKDLSEVDQKLISMLGEPTVETKKGYHYYFNVKDSSSFITKTGVFEHVDIRSEGGLVFNNYWGTNKNMSYKVVGDAQKMPKKLNKYLVENMSTAPKNKKTKILYNNTDKKKLKDIMSYIKCYDDYTEWFTVGMALKAWDEERGLAVWDKWSKQSDAYEPGACERKWKTFKPDGNVGVGTLYHLAQDAGYIVEHKPMFHKIDKISVADPDYQAPEIELERDAFHYESWMGDAPINTKAVKAYLKNTGYDPKSSKFKWVSSSGIIREFNKQDVANFFKTYHIKAEETEESMAFIDQWLAENSTLTQPKEKEYWKYIHKCMLDWVMFHHQYKTMRVKVNPFGQNGVAFDNSTMIIITKDVIPKKPNKVEDDAVIADYKQHFPELDSVLDVMLSARFGADRKKAYLWMKCMSDWGKSFFFVGVLGSLGITTMLKEKELKKAMAGDPSGLMGDDFYTSWITIFEEFKGAVSELKDITHTLIVAPKGQARVEVDLYSKVFLSAETVNSLVGDNGAEKQFANRFMMMELDGMLTQRPLYNQNQNYYRDAIRWYVYSYILRGVEEYLSLGENKASIKANKMLHEFRENHVLQAEDIMKSVGEVREQYFDEVKMKLKTFGEDKAELHDLFLLREGDLYVKKLGLVKEHFLHTMFAKNDISKLNHKSSLEVLNLSPDDRSTLRNKGVKYNVYKI